MQSFRTPTTITVNIDHKCRIADATASNTMNMKSYAHTFNSDSCECVSVAVTPFMQNIMEHQHLSGDNNHTILHHVCSRLFNQQG